MKWKILFVQNKALIQNCFWKLELLSYSSFGWWIWLHNYNVFFSKLSSFKKLLESKFRELSIIQISKRCFAKLIPKTTTKHSGTLKMRTSTSWPSTKALTKSTSSLAYWLYKSNIAMSALCPYSYSSSSSSSLYLTLSLFLQRVLGTRPLPSTLRAPLMEKQVLTDAELL